MRKRTIAFGGLAAAALAGGVWYSSLDQETRDLLAVLPTWADALPASAPARIDIGVLAVLDSEDTRRLWQPLADGLARARGALASGVARAKLDQLVMRSQALAQGA